MRRILNCMKLVCLAGCVFVPLLADDEGDRSGCKDLPDHATLRRALSSVAPSPTSANGGLNFNMWATIVNGDGVVCAVAFTGPGRHDQWPGSRVISAQKANTANAFSLPNFALSTANLYTAVQPGGTLFGLQHSNPVDTRVAYAGNSKNNGQPNDPIVGFKIGGVNVFGGGLTLYSRSGLVGALGVSGDTSCTDHVVAWKVRDMLKLDFVPDGVAGHTDNIIFDISEDAHGHPKSTSGFGHPTCGGVDATTAAGLLKNFPIGSNR